jgi:protein O-GlcNAc transferase
MDRDLLQEAVAHADAGRLQEAERACAQVLRLDPQNAGAWGLYGIIAQRAGQLPAALEALGRAAVLRPDVAGNHYELANVLRAMGKLPQAIESYRRALAIQPDYADALVNLGIALANSGKRDEAGEAWRAALKINPRDFEALVNLVNHSRSLGRLSEAIDYARRALAIDPGSATAVNNLASVYQQQGRLDEAIAQYRRAIKLPGASIYAYSNLLLNLQYDGTFSPQEVFAEHLRWAQRYEAPLAATIRPHTNDRSPDRRLKIGYVSPDFRDHAIAFFMEPILAHHDPEQVEVFCYAAAPTIDGVTRRLQRYVRGQNWRTIFRVRDADAAEMVRRDGIDILVDLAAHTSAHRLRLFAHKPAPVQVTYLGYAGTTGMNTIDWRITDAIVDPPPAASSVDSPPAASAAELGLTEALHTEKLMRLPRTQWCYRPPSPAPPVAEGPARTNGFVTFGNATNLAKITPRTLDLWARVLVATPGSHLALKSKSFTDDATRERVTAEFANRGVSAERMTLVGGGDLADYLGFFSRIDVCLDTFPFAGGTTTCHTLFMGVPVITLVGPTSVSRVGASVLTNVGLTELIAEMPGQFVQIATDLAGDAERLGMIRQSLRERMLASPLCDEPGFVRELELAYRQMWRAWCGK